LCKIAKRENKRVNLYKNCFFIIGVRTEK